MKVRNVLLGTIIPIVVFVLTDMAISRILPPAYQSTKYGWTVNEGTMTLRVRDTLDSTRTVKATFGRNGFRRWGDVNTHKIKMLILGDSFTQMQWVSNGEEWYAYLEKAFGNLELFVYGGGGYGTLQEYLVLDDYIDEIKPDIILLQFTGNDYFNNVYKLDREKYPYNNFGVRPYLEQGEIVYRMPMKYGVLRQYSAIADRILLEYDVRLKAEQARLRQMEPAKHRKYIDEEKIKFRQVRMKYRDIELKTIKEIFSLVRKRAGVVPVYLFSVGKLEDELNWTCQKTKIVCIPGIGELVKEAIANGRELKVVNNGHWNKAGNAMAGRALAEYFRTNGIIDN